MQFKKFCLISIFFYTSLIFSSAAFAGNCQGNAKLANSYESTLSKILWNHQICYDWQSPLYSSDGQTVLFMCDPGGNNGLEYFTCWCADGEGCNNVQCKYGENAMYKNYDC